MKRQNYYWFIILIFISSAFVTCNKGSNINLPTAKTYTPFFVASTSATAGFKVESDGGSKIIDCGVYLGLAASPETSGSKLSVASDTGAFVFQVNGLLPGTQFYMKAYATNELGEGLSDEETFTTPATITDNSFDNNVYETVIIANQVWMAKNLRATHFINGDPIGTTIPPTLDLSGESSPKYQWSYGGDDANVSDYGKLYTYYAITDSRKVCPAGWHVPTDPEWTTLENTLGGFTVAGSALKEAKNSHWISPYNLDATNITCFKALPGGYRNYTGGTGGFSFIGNYGYWWTSTAGDTDNAWLRSLFVQSGQLTRSSFIKKTGVSVRCLKD